MEQHKIPKGANKKTWFPIKNTVGMKQGETQSIIPWESASSIRQIRFQKWKKTVEIWWRSSCTIIASMIMTHLRNLQSAAKWIIRQPNWTRAVIWSRDRSLKCCWKIMQAPKLQDSQVSITNKLLNNLEETWFNQAEVHSDKTRSKTNFEARARVCTWIHQIAVKDSTTRKSVAKI